MMKLTWSLGSATLLIGLVTAGFLIAAGTSPAPVSEVPFGKYAPEQPIPYSHKQHAGDYSMDCKFCHTYARRSKNAGIPALEQCMMCHRTLGADKPNIQALADAFAKEEPVQWVKVHSLPGFVDFNHERHVKAGFTCQECHGPVETMPVVYRNAPLTMGWCLECHKDNLEKGASVDCTVCHK